jgi:hypothetical protein
VEMKMAFELVRQGGQPALGVYFLSASNFPMMASCSARYS